MPWPVQLLEQTARFSQPYPEKPGAQAQLPLWQRPLPLQLRGQAAGASKEVKCAVSDQAPEEHKPDGSKLPLRRALCLLAAHLVEHRPVPMAHLSAATAFKYSCRCN